MNTTRRSDRVYDAPMALNDTLDHTRGLEKGDAKWRIEQHVQESKKHVVGPMPPSEFMEKLLPSASSGVGMLSCRDAFRALLSDAASATDICQSLIRALSRKTKYKSRCPGFTFVPSSQQPSQPHRPAYVHCYSAANIKAAKLTGSELGFSELFIDIHSDSSRDYFADPGTEPSSSPSFIPHIADVDARGRRDRAWGEHISYVTEILARQHRNFAFSVTLFGSRARLLRWDRAGCVVSEAFDICDQPELFCDFLWKFSQTSDAGRGHDITVEVAHPDEEKLFHAAIRKEVQRQLDIDGAALDHAVTEHYQPGHVAAIQVVFEDPGSSAPRTRRLIVSRPVASPLSATGRGTRGYWALDIDSGAIVFLKDTWRSMWQAEIEGQILLKLSELGVRNITELVYHGDVTELTSTTYSPRHTTTTTDSYASCSWASPIDGKIVVPSTYVHYRMVLATVGYGLNRFRGTKELLFATYDVYQAMQDAYRLDSRIHRDISLGNVILVKRPNSDVRRGLLIDWEVSSQVDENGESKDRERTGTWYFTSGRLLMDNDLVHTMLDDMESLMYLVMYCSLSWLPHDLTAKRLAATIHALFASVDYEIYQPRFGLTGGSGKVANEGTRQWTKHIEWDGPIHDWLNGVMDLHYKRANRAIISQWTHPSQLEDFWSAFLRDNELPSSDRMEHPRPAPPPIEATTPILAPVSSNSLGKRSSERVDGDDMVQRESKRPKVLVPGPPSPDQNCQPPPPPPSPRRLRARGPDGRTLKQEKAPNARAVRETVPRSSKSKPSKSRQRRTC